MTSLAVDINKSIVSLMDFRQRQVNNVSTTILKLLKKYSLYPQFAHYFPFFMENYDIYRAQSSQTVLNKIDGSKESFFD
jgi:hypothetical protein